MSRQGRGGGVTWDFPIIDTPYAPEGSALLVPAGAFDFTPPIRWHTDPPTFGWYTDVWPAPPPSFSEVAALERARALAHLAGLLDDWCHELGADPDKVWRGPRARETEDALWASNHRTYMAETRLSMSILNPRNAAVITNC